MSLAAATAFGVWDLVAYIGASVCEIPMIAGWRRKDWKKGAVVLVFLLAGSAFLDGCISLLWTHCQARAEKEAWLFFPVIGFRRDRRAEITTFLPVCWSALRQREYAHEGVPDLYAFDSWRGKLRHWWWLGCYLPRVFSLKASWGCMCFTEFFFLRVINLVGDDWLERYVFIRKLGNPTGTKVP